MHKAIEALQPIAGLAMHQCSILPLLKVPPAPGVTSGATYAIADAGAQMFNEKKKRKGERASVRRYKARLRDVIYTRVYQ